MRRICCALLCVFASACGTVVSNPVSLSDPNFTAAVPEKEYRIQVGDALDVKFYYNTELNESVIVRPDGRITLQLVHDLYAAGLTPAELTKVLEERYAREVKKPEIAVLVKAFNKAKVYVDGEVGRPGLLPMMGEMTLLQSISAAGGFRETARVNEVIIIRKGRDSRPGAITANLDNVINGTDLSQDVLLMPNDIVFVPRSSIANVNLWIDQYIRKNIPVSTGFGFSYGLNNNSD